MCGGEWKDIVLAGIIYQKAFYTILIPENNSL